MTAPAFIYTSEPWAALSFGRPISAQTKTHFAFRVDIWDDTGDCIVEHVAGIDDFEVAEATYWAAVACWPAARITLRQGIRAVRTRRVAEADSDLSSWIEQVRIAAVIAFAFAASVARAEIQTLQRTPTRVVVALNRLTSTWARHPGSPASNSLRLKTACARAR